MDTPNLTSSTGQNDSSSIWGSGFLGFATGLGNVASGIIGAVRGNGTGSGNQAAAPSAPSAQTALPSWILPVGIGVAVIIAAVLIFRKL